MNNLFFVLRKLRKTPGFSLLAIAVLALGLGMSIAIFSLINQLFFHTLPFADPERLVRIYGQTADGKLTQAPFSIPRFWHYRDGQDVFAAIGADSFTNFTLSGMGEPIQLNGEATTANYFELLGVKPIQGRLFRAEEEQTVDIALVSESFWRKRLGGDPAIIGRSITLNGISTTIIGVLPDMPAAWFGPNCEIWTVKPFEFNGFSRELLMRGVSFLRVVGRLKKGVTVEQARASLFPLQQSYRSHYPDAADNSWLPRVVSAVEDTTENLRTTFTLLAIAVGVLLLIACSNVANLLLVRFISRRHETALRIALGASRGSIVRLFLLESMLVGGIAGMVGLVLAIGITSTIPKLLGINSAFQVATKLDLGIVIIGLGFSLLTGLIVGLYPAGQSSRPDLLADLKEGGRGTRGSRTQHRVRSLLIASQVTLSLILAVGAVLLVGSLVRLSQQNPGCQLDRLWVASIGLPPASYPDSNSRTRFAERFQQEFRTLPGVEAVAIGDALPLTGNQARSPYARLEAASIPVNQRPFGLLRVVMPGYFHSLGVPLVMGREFTEQDRGDGPAVVIVSQALARALFPGEDPIGRAMMIGTQDGIGQRCEIVGVVGDVRSIQLAKPDDVEFYRPWSQRNFPFLFFGVRTSLSPRATETLVRTALDRIDPRLAIVRPTTMDAVVSESLTQQRLTMMLFTVFALSALLLSNVGIYGAVAYSVAQRTNEIGIRRALGAPASDIMLIVVRHGMRPVVIGLFFGVMCAFGLAHFIDQMLFDISLYNLLSILSPAIVLALVALLACVIPARRAIKISAIEALRAL
jgi:putative ABC transport system permease protein